MRTKLLLLATLISIFICTCEKGDNGTLGGEQSVMGQVGEEVYSFDISGVEQATATVTSLEDGISTFSGSAVITHPAILNIVSDIPDFEVNGNNVTVTGLKFKVTTEGIESKNPSYPGIIVKYASNVGDTYSAGSGVTRKVISKSVDDDYPYLYLNIKVIKVEESPSIIPGVKKLVYIANHRFGIVGLELTVDDNTTTSFIFGGSSEN
jgi:hypothetical protein